MNPIGPEVFEDNLTLHVKCGFHVQVIYYMLSVAAVLVDLIAVVLGLILFMYPEFHRKSAVYPYFFQHYDRTVAYHYYILYNSVIFFWILLYFLHMLSIGLSIFGVHLRKPYLMLTQLILLVIRIGLLVILFCALITFNFVSVAMEIISTLVVFVLLVFSGIYLVSTVLCFRFVYEKYDMIQLILANSKTVHFKERKRRK